MTFRQPERKSSPKVIIRGPHHFDDDFRSGCRNVSHHYGQQSFSELHSPGRSNYTITPNILRSPYTEFEYQYYSILGSPALAIAIPSCKVLISFTVSDLVDVDLHNRMFNRSCSIRTPILCKYSCAYPQFQ